MCWTGYLILELTKHINIAGSGIPQVDRGAEGDGEDILRGPIQKVEVVVVLQVRSIKDALWSRGNVPELGDDLMLLILGVEHAEVVREVFSGPGGLLLESQDLTV